MGIQINKVDVKLGNTTNVGIAKEEILGMKSGDIIVNIGDRLVVTFRGWVAGDNSSYEIKLDDRLQGYTGTVAGVIERCSKIVGKHNKVCQKHGGTLL